MRPRPPRSTQSRSSAASDVYKRQLLESLEVREQLLVHEVAEVVAHQRPVVVQGTGCRERHGPGVPAEALFQQKSVRLAMEDGDLCAVLFERVEVLEEEDPGGLLDVV